MADDDKWFTEFRGRGTLRIVPRNAKGWVVLIGFVALTVAIVALVPNVVHGVAWLPLVVIVPLTAAFVLIAHRKSRVVDLRTLDADLAELAARRARDTPGR